MIFDRLLKRREENGSVGKAERQEEVRPEDMQEFKNRMFGLMLQVIYNSTTVLKAVLHGDDWSIHGDPVTSAIIDGDLVINTLKKMGLYPRFTMKEFEDGSRGLKWLNKAIVNGLREEFYDMEDIRDGKIFMLDEKIASIQKRLETATGELDTATSNIRAIKHKYNRAYDTFLKCKTDTRAAFEHLKHMSCCHDPQEMSASAKACLENLIRAMSYSIPEKYQVEEESRESKEQKEQNAKAKRDNTGCEAGGPTPEEAEKAVEDYYNRELQGSQGAEGKPEHCA